MKKIYTILLLVATMFAAGNISAATDSINAKLNAKADSTIITVSTDAALLNQGLQLSHINFGKATELKDSIAAVLQALPNDSASQKIKKQTIDIVAQALADKKSGQSFWTEQNIERVIALVAALIAFLAGHFRVFFKKKDTTAAKQS